MGKKLLYSGVFVLVLMVYLFSTSPVAAQKKGSIIGREILNFTLPSTQDRLINYADEYYGKHHLIMTFFPAAFTPI